MSTSLLTITLIIILIIMICPIIVINIKSNKSKDKQIFKDITVIIGVINIIACVVLLSLWITPFKEGSIKKSNSKTTTTTTESTSTEDELSKAGFNELTLDEYLEKIKSSEKTIILIARPTCYYCQQFTPVLKQAKEELGLTINYINTDNLSSSDWDTFQKSLDYLNSEEWGTPLTLIVQNGEVLADNSGYVDLSTIKQFFTDNGLGNK